MILIPFSRSVLERFLIVSMRVDWRPGFGFCIASIPDLESVKITTFSLGISGLFIASHVKAFMIA